MCGISGIYTFKGKKHIDAGVVTAMMNAIAHRGPDGSDSLVMDGLAFGFNRLSFLDLKGGMQPLYNEDRTVSMICNGEIFNYKELKEELKQKGHEFRTETDVECIVHLYEEYGSEFVIRLNGQFAIALYDSRSDDLLLVRDRIGISPLFYIKLEDRIVFASEIKAILEHPEVPRRLNLKAVDQLMNFPGIVSPVTFFRGISALAPGHMLTVTRDGIVKDREYWDLQYSPEEEDKGEEYYVERLRELIRDSISRRLLADVPIGFYVSGGLDSSVIACNIGKYLLNSGYSFSAEIGENDLDESRFQKIVRDTLGSEHYSVRVDEKVIWETLPKVIWHAESAVKESYDAAAYMLSGLVQESPAKAVLTGQGSDEFFCGYVGYMVDLFRYMQKDNMSREELEVNERLWGDPYFRYERNHPQLRETGSKLYHPSLRSEIDSFSAWKESPVNVERLRGLSSQKRRSYIDYKLRLSDHLLGEHGDRMFFSHSIEGRHPFLDNELIDFIITIPDKYKLKGVNEKYILKKAGEGIVPKEILKRKKFPFQAPGMSAMIKKPSPNVSIDEELIRKQGIFDPEYVNELRKVYAAENFKLMGAYEIDYLLIVLTVTMLCEQYGLTL